MLAEVRKVSLEKIEKSTVITDVDIFEQIRQYSYWFNLDGSKLKDFINRKGKGNNFDQKAEYVLRHIESLKNECIEQAAHHNKALKDYQRKAVNHMLTHRGMIAAFEVGTGKTLTAVATANCNINLANYFGVEFYVIVMTPVSLQDNFKNEMKAYGANIDAINVANRYIYIFYTYEKFSRDYRDGLIQCQNTLFIIDEAHNMRTDYREIFTEFQIKTNKEEKVGRAENSVKCSSNAMKVLLLTGTPVYNATSDIVNLVAMVDGYYPPSEINPRDIIGDKKLFTELYGDRFLFQKNNKNDFPERIDITVAIAMDEDFLREYEKAEKSVMSQSKMQKFARAVQTEESIIKKNNAFYVELRKKVNNIEPCYKCDEAIHIIEEAVKKREKVLLFSNFLDSGVNMIIDRIPSGIHKLVITGKVTGPNRQKIVNTFNNKGFVGVLIVTRTGGEGLDLKEVRHVIAYEKGWNVASMEQYIGRAIRYRSHSDLPPEKRNVTVWHLAMIKPNDYQPRYLLDNDPLNDKITDRMIYLPREIYEFSDEVKIIYGNESELNMPVIYPQQKSADLYMYINMIKKEEELIRLKEALEEIQIQ